MARRLSLPTARSTIQHFEDQIAIVIERYDRRRTQSGILRVHQEDVCQVMGVPPTRKFENDGGPGASAIIDTPDLFAGLDQHRGVSAPRGTAD